MKTKFIALAALFGTSPAIAQSWGPLGQQTPLWVQVPTVGYPGNDVTSETFTATQGGDPPAVAYEPADIDEAGRYTRNQWIVGDGISRIDSGQAKFRTNCAFAKFGQFDPIVGHGQPVFGHHHTFFGNMGVTANSDYASLRNSPKSSCAGGPLNATAYWEPTLFYEIAAGVVVPVKPNIVTFYYNLEAYVGADKRVRPLNDFAFIGGVNPQDPTNSARQSEISTGFDKARNRPGRYDGWYGWQCYAKSGPKVGTTVMPTGPGVFPALSASFTRNLVNPDGSDPWHGQCEGSDYTLIANIVAPPCWDGKNLRSPDGRQHMRYPLYRDGYGGEDDRVCPDHWYWVMHFEVKTEFPAYTFAMRRKMYLSSDRMDPNPATWQTPGSTMHFDWMGGWDRHVMNRWLMMCTGTRINGQAAADHPDGYTCGDSTISQTERLLVGNRSPDPTLSNDPVVTMSDYGAPGTPSSTRFGLVTPGTAVNATTH
ncbi:MAG: DUF1996 domain-containing protein [Sphingomonas sp.]|uniref:DUF1996 domain-containing protein n=1 Tax=Sphingomonas sp. TaxID=28214 RepID=UPI001AD3D194|nr:DUF1996 domain-containing protein [Sphingomonas sp.]MBN8807885.1 DUF1996 domain-containing protein [Sphingomonas sp.]